MTGNFIEKGEDRVEVGFSRYRAANNSRSSRLWPSKIANVRRNRNLGWTFLSGQFFVATFDYIIYY